MYLRLNPYDEIVQGILVGLQIDEGIIKITGRKDSGKTALCSRLCEDLQANGHPAILFGEPPASAIALQKAVVDRLQLDASSNFTRALSTWLLARNTDEKPLVLIFDDAQRLDPPTFSAIRMLCNIQSGTRSLVRVVLCGSDELDARIAGPALRAVTQFISQSFTLPFLTREQVRDFRQAYCLQMQMQTGHDMKALDERALDRLFHDTKGQPGMLYARLEQERAAQLDQQGAAQETAAAQASEAPLVKTPPAEHGETKPPRLRALAIAAGLLVAVAAGAYLYRVLPVPAEQETAARGDADAAPSPVSSPAAVAGTPIVEPTPDIPVVDAPPVVPAAVASTDTTIGAAPSDVPAAEEAASLAQVVGDAQSEATPTEPAPPAEPLIEQAPPAASPEVTIADTQATPALEASAPEAPVTAASRTAAPVEDFIAGWTASWQAQDVEDYLAHYHRDFAPIQGTRAGWEQQRRRVIENAREIVITADAPQSNVEAQDGMRVVRFWLNYRAANYADRTLKELVLARVGDEWRIRAERNLLTEAL